MKNTTTIILLAAVLSFTACAEKKTTTEESAVTEVTDTITSDTVANDAEQTDIEENKVITVKGTVTEINNGKDGYTAKLKTDEGKFYFATISIPNLDNPKQYRAVKIGDVITVKGESFPIEEDISIKVTELL